MKQPSVITFFHPKQIEIMKERSAQNRSKNRTFHNSSKTTITNYTNPDPPSRIPNKPIKTHWNHSSNLIQQQPRNSHHPVDATSNKTRQHRAIVNPYLVSIVPQSRDISSNESPPTLTTPQNTMLQESNITSTKLINMRTPKDSLTQTYTKTNNHIRERIPSSKLQSYPKFLCTE